MFDLKSAFKITQLDESERENILAALLTIGEEFHRIPISLSEMTRVEFKEKTLKDKARMDSRGRYAL